MALDSRVVLSGTLPTRTGAFKDLADSFGQAPFRRRELERQTAADQRTEQLFGQQLQLGEQSLAAGGRTADLAEQQQILIGLQAGVNAFERGDSAGVEKAIRDTVPPEEQVQELAEFRANPAAYIAQAKDLIGAVKSQQKGSGRTAGQREFSTFTEGLPDEDVLQARRIKLGLEAKASAGDIQTIDIGGVPHLFDRVTQTVTPVTTGGEQVTTESVGKSKGAIKASEDAAKAAIKLSTKTFERIEPLTQNLVNIDDAIRLIDEGAATGPIISKLPSIRKSSIELDTLQKKLGLDVIASTTFGALSEGEREFALSTALPSNLKGPDLKRWLQRKKITQQKLIQQFSDAATFLGTPGNTIADFIELQKIQDLEAQDSQKDTGISADQFRAMSTEQRAQALSRLQGQ